MTAKPLIGNSDISIWVRNYFCGTLIQKQKTKQTKDVSLGQLSYSGMGLRLSSSIVHRDLKSFSQVLTKFGMYHL